MQYRALGLMSGTSLDGLDIVDALFEKTDTRWTYRILHASTYPYTREWQQKLTFKESWLATEILELDVEYGLYLAQLCQKFLTDFQINPSSLNIIASHGHTLFHQPEKGYTYQIGNGPQLHSRLNITTIGNFRTQDVALGGQGAPLVPIGDQYLFPQYDACLNLGGFANISFEKNGSRMAYDICPLNYVLNSEAQKLGLDYDDQGNIARQNEVDTELLEKLSQISFYSQSPPKSLGAEWVQSEFLPLVAKAKLPPEVLLSTYTCHMARQIAETVKVNGLKNILVTGGGAFNTFLLESISESSGIQLTIPEAQLINFKEALIFAFMGVLKLRGENNVLSSVTGASGDHCSGIIYG